jgi:hypothetical protein
MILSYDVSFNERKNKSPGSDDILEELVQTGGEILLSAIHKLINFVWNKEKLSDQ